MSDSFKEYLEENFFNGRKKTKEELNINENEEEEVFQQISLIEKSSCEIDYSGNEGICGLKIRDSLLLSCNVTKFRPHYPSLDEQLQSNARMPAKTPVKSGSRNKFAHIKSPVAQYIYGSRSPQIMNVRFEPRAQSTSPISKGRISLFEGKDVAVEKSSLPMVRLTKSSKVIKVGNHEELNFDLLSEFE